MVVDFLRPVAHTSNVYGERLFVLGGWADGEGVPFVSSYLWNLQKDPIARRMFEMRRFTNFEFGNPVYDGF